jgi:hypothetical protein
MKLLDDSSSMNFGTIIFAVIMTSSIFFAEKLVKEIFGFKRSSTLAEKVMAGAVITNVVSNVKNIAAIKNAVEDTNVNRKLKTVPNKMPDGSDVTPQSILKAKRDAEARKASNTSGQQNTNQGSSSGSSNPSAPYYANRKNRRRLRNMRGPISGKIRGFARGYGRVFATTNGINYGKAKWKKHTANQAKRKVAGMSDRQLFEAFSENYRQANNLNDQDLVKELNRLYNADISSLTSKEDIIFKTMIEKQKMQYAKQGQNPLQVMQDIIKYGTEKA